MSLTKVFKKILSVTLVLAFLMQQSSFVFAADVDNWADLKAGVEGVPGEYNVTTALTAADAPDGTLDITADNTVTGSSLTENLAHDTLINVNGGATLGLGNDISGSIVNDGTLNYSGSSLADGSVTGNGDLAFQGVTVTNGNTINQNAVSVSAATTLTNNAAVTATTFTNNGSVDNNATITASITNEGTLASTADNLAGAVENNNALTLEGGTLSVAVTGAGNTNIKGDLDNKGSISQDNINIDSGVVVTSNASDMTATTAINNDGIINYTGGSTANTITGNGRIDITGYVTNTGDITQTTVSNSSVFTNNGTVTANITNTNAIEGTGSITTGTGVSSNNGTIAQASLTNNGTFDNNGHITLTGALTNNDTFNTNADLLVAAGGVANEGDLNLTGGTNTNVITGAGTTNFSNTATNNAAITQATVTNNGTLTNNALITADVANTGTLTSNGANIIGDITNTGTYVISDGNNANDIIGAGGTLSILGDTANTGSIEQETVAIANSGNLTTHADSVTAAITNDGKLKWTDGTHNENAISGSGQLDITGGTIVNSASIEQNEIRIAGSGSLTSNADLLAATSGITNNVADGLTLTGGTNTNVITGVGSMATTGDVTNNATINQDTITVSSGKLTTAADAITTANGITNNDAISFTSGDNNNDITGTGTTYIDGAVQNLADIYTDVQVNTGAHYGTATDVHANLENRGAADLIDADIDSAASITGTGTTNILGATVNNGDISQSAVVIAAGGSLTTDSQKVDAAITNDGSIVWNGGNSNDNVITGNGSLEVNGATVTNNAAINQGDITITNGSLTSSADLLASTNGITNNVADGLTLTGGTNTNAISGTGSMITTGDVTNQAAINQDSVAVNGGKLTTDASLLTTANGVTVASGAGVSLTGGTNTNAITGDGTTYIDGTVENKGNIETNIGVGTNGHYATDQDIVKNLDNNGIVDITDADVTSTGSITGTGTTNILGTTSNEGTIRQSEVNIAAGASLSTVSNDVTGVVNNDGTYTWVSGTANSNVINGSGNIVILGGDITNTQSISQNSIEVQSAALLQSNADLLTTVSGIANEGNLEFLGGTNTNTVTGAGTTTVTNATTNNAAITQTSVVNNSSLTNNALIAAAVTNNGTFTTEGGNVDGAVTNNSSYIITNGDNANDISGTGALQIFGNTTNTATIEQDTLVIDTGATFVAFDMNDITATSGIDNNGTFEMQAGTNTNAITSSGNTGALKVTGGSVTNQSGAGISQDTIDIATLGDFTADAADLVTVNGITNAGALTLGDGDTANNISGNGTLAVTGTVTNTGNINQKSLVNTGTLTSDASLLAFADGIASSNTLNLTGGTNANAISGTGTTNFTNDVVNNATIEQATVTNDTGTLTNNAAITAATLFDNSGTVDNNAAITGNITNTGTINSSADNLVGAVDSNGTLNISGGTVQGPISGTGDMNITGDLTNGQDIVQATVNNSANMTNSGGITADFNNSGVLDNSAIITGAITNTGTINSAADNLIGTIANDGTLNLDGGVVQEVISGTGDTNITGDLTNDYAITQGSVTNDANLDNNATITADTITNNGTITGAASDLVASNGIVNEGSLVFDAASTGASDISGNGDVKATADTTLTGTNTYAGGTIIDGATLTVAGQDNLSTGDVSFDNNGVLAVTAAGSLDNTLKGVDAADHVTVQNDADLMLNGIVDAAADFHKAGAGTMTLAMEENGYTGDTYVDGGTLIGNTLNINNTVNGAAGTTVEFTDTEDAELNAINTLGTFVQSGSAVLNVESNAFSAAQVDLNAGTFAANRAMTADVLNVNNGATLRGNGNITGTVNVNNGGTIAPGNSIDTLTITGDVNFASGSTTAIEITDTPASDKLVVSNNANIASGANLTVSNISGRYFEWDTFDIVEAGNVTGEFTYDGTITDYDASRINVEVDYTDPTKVVLTAKRKATDYSGTNVGGLSRNQNEAAKAIDAVSTGFGGDITEALLQYEKLGGLDPEGVTLINPDATLKSALDDTYGVLYANSALVSLFNAKTAHVYDRIAKRNPSSGKCPTCHDNVWVEYYNQYDKVYANPNSPRFTNTMTGVLVGYDRSSEDVLLGVYGGFGKSDLRERASRSDIEDTTLGLYAGYTTGDWIFKGTLYGGYQHYHAKRAITFMGRRANASYTGLSLALDLEGAYNIPVYSWLNVKPFVGVLGSYAHQQSFTEKGAGALNLHVYGNDQYNTQARLGVQLDGKLAHNKLSWYGSVAVKQFIGDDYAKLHMTLDQLPGTSMDIISNELGRTYFSGQFGLSYALTHHWSVFGNLDTGVNNRAANCYGNLGVAYVW